MSGLVVWISGLPSSGKTTVARAVRELLVATRKPVCLLDSDEVRDCLRPPPSYDAIGRDAFYETLARLAALLARQGLIVLTPATAHRRAYRERARSLAPAFVEVHVGTSLEECERRDAKGLYARARRGEIQGFPGVHEAFEAPENADLTVSGGATQETVQAIAERVTHFVLQQRYNSAT